MPNPRGPAFLYKSFAIQDYCTITPADAAFEPAGMPASNLKQEEPTKRARILSLDPLKTRWIATLTKGSDRNVSGMVLVNANLSPWGHFRYISGTPSIEDIAPNDLLDSSNATGDETAVDELISSSDANIIEPISFGDPYWVKLGFPNPSGAFVTGIARGMFVVRVSLNGTPNVYYPKVTATLYQYNTPLEIEFDLGVLGSRAVDSHRIFIFHFNPSTLNNINGNSIRLRLDFEPGDESSYVELETVRLYRDYTAIAQDSGWIPSSLAYWTDEKVGPPVQHQPYWPPSEWTSVSQLSIWLLDDQVDPNPDLGTSPPDNGVPANNVTSQLALYGKTYLQAGVLDFGTALFLSCGVLQSNPIGTGIEVTGQYGEAAGGNAYGADEFIGRKIPMTEFVVTIAEGHTLQNLIVSHGKSRPFFFSFDPDWAQQYQIYQSLYCLISDTDRLQTIPQHTRRQLDVNPNTPLFTIGLALDEKI